jgi:hypothetical protein
MSDSSSDSSSSSSSNESSASSGSEYEIYEKPPEHKVDVAHVLKKDKEFIQSISDAFKL